MGVQQPITTDKMKIEVGKCYKVRMGGFVYIEKNANEIMRENSPKPFGGSVVKTLSKDVLFCDKHIRLCFFTKNGEYNASGEKSDFDIIEEVEAEEYIEYRKFIDWCKAINIDFNKVDMETLRNIYNAIDDEDK